MAVNQTCSFVHVLPGEKPLMFFDEICQTVPAIEGIVLLLGIVFRELGRVREKVQASAPL
jgi:hypothetical protein